MMQKLIRKRKEKIEKFDKIKVECDSKILK